MSGTKTKRGHGEGSFRKLPSGKWLGRISINGKRYSITADSLPKARAQLAALVAEVERGLEPVTAREKVGDYLIHWLAVEASRLRSNSVRTYRFMIDSHIKPGIGELQLRSLQPMRIQQFYTDLQAKGLAPASIRLIHCILHKAFAQAVKWRILSHNPAEGVSKPSVRQQEPRILTPEEIKLLFAAIKDSPHEAFVVTAISTGLRKGELLGLMWPDVDLDRGILHVRRQLTERMEITEPKTASSRRSIALPEVAAEALRKHRLRQLQIRLALGAEWEDHDLVFPNTFGRPMQSQQATRIWHEALKKAGLPRMPLHAARHTHASLLIMGGANARIVQERLGHANVSITLSIYSHLLPNSDAEIARKFDALLA